MAEEERYIKVERMLDGRWQEVGFIGIPEVGQDGGFMYSDSYDGPPLTPDMDPAVTGSRWFPLSVANQGHLRASERDDLHSVFAQALPGRWGETVMASHVRSYGRASPCERLWLLGDRRAGALRFLPGGRGMLDRCIEGFEALDALRKRVNVFVERLMRSHAMPREGMGKDSERWALVTNGGATPKCAYKHAGLNAEYVAKFNLAVTGATYPTTRVEAATLDVSRAAGLDTPETVLIDTPDGDAVLLSRRFDQADGEHQHKINAATALGLPLTAYGSYADMAAWLRTHGSQPDADIRDLYGRMMLNVAVHNTDDHLGQFEFLQERDGRWRLAPNYDVLVDEPDAHGNYAKHAMRVAGSYQPQITPALVEDSAREFGIESDEAHAITERVLDAVDGFGMALKQRGVSELDIDRLVRSTDTAPAREALRESRSAAQVDQRGTGMGM